MARKEVLDLFEKYVDPFSVTKGDGFRLKDFDPGSTCGLQLDKGEAANLLQPGHVIAGERAGDALCAGPPVAADYIPSNGCSG